MVHCKDNYESTYTLAVYDVGLEPPLVESRFRDENGDD